MSGDVQTNTIDGFWALLKNGIGAVYRGMFNAMVSRIEKKASSSVSPSSDH